MTIILVFVFIQKKLSKHHESMCLCLFVLHSKRQMIGVVRIRLRRIINALSKHA